MKTALAYLIKYGLLTLVGGFGLFVTFVVGVLAWDAVQRVGFLGILWGALKVVGCLGGGVVVLFVCCGIASWADEHLKSRKER